MHWRPSPGEPASDPPSTADTSDRAGIVDVRVLEELVGGEPEIVRDFLLQYRTSAGVIMTDIRGGHASDDLVAIGRATHKLKSSSRAIGAAGLGELCARIEVAATDGDAPAVAAMYPALERAVAAVEEAVDRLVGTA